MQRDRAHGGDHRAGSEDDKEGNDRNGRRNGLTREQDLTGFKANLSGLFLDHQWCNAGRIDLGLVKRNERPDPLKPA